MAASRVSKPRLSVWGEGGFLCFSLFFFPENFTTGRVSLRRRLAEKRLETRGVLEGSSKTEEREVFKGIHRAGLRTYRVQNLLQHQHNQLSRHGIATREPRTRSRCSGQNSHYPWKNISCSEGRLVTVPKIFVVAGPLHRRQDAEAKNPKHIRNAILVSEGGTTRLCKAMRLRSLPGGLPNCKPVIGSHPSFPELPGIVYWHSPVPCVERRRGRNLETSSVRSSTVRVQTCRLFSGITGTYKQWGNPPS